MLSLNTAGALAMVLGCSLSWSQELPWHLGSVNGARVAPAAINTAGLKPGPHGVVVAVVDRDVLGAHPSLEGNLLAGVDLVNRSDGNQARLASDLVSESLDARCRQRLRSSAVRSHGTAVASLIAGNGVGGVWGVNTDAKIVPIQVYGTCGVARQDVLDALAWAAGLPVAGVPNNPNPARIINLSLSGGYPVCGADMQELLNRVIAKKIFVVAAAGNNYQQALQEPANCQGVISVGALDAENRISNYTALDPRTVIYAPGGGTNLPGQEPWSTNKLWVASFDLDPNGQEIPGVKSRGIGTSYAASIVSGFLSLWLSHRPEKTPQDFLNEIERFTRPVEPVAKCRACTPRGLAAVQNFDGS